MTPFYYAQGDAVKTVYTIEVEGLDAPVRAGAQGNVVKWDKRRVCVDFRGRRQWLSRDAVRPVCEPCGAWTPTAGVLCDACEALYTGVREYETGE